MGDFAVTDVTNDGERIPQEEDKESGAGNEDGVDL